MDSIRLFMLAASLLSAMLGGLYATRGQAATTGQLTAMASAAGTSSPSGHELDAPNGAPHESLPRGLDVPPASAEGLSDGVSERMSDGADGHDDAVFVDAATGVTLGPLKLRRPSSEPTEREVVARGAVAREVTARPQRVATRTTRTAEPTPARRASSREEPVRLDADPGRNVLLTARGMMARGQTVRGSCYSYLSEVFRRAGHDGWRTRTIVHQAGARGPYADLDRIRPGDWLYIVTDPDSTPVRTHSVLFVGWEDRSQGYARTISHPGWAAGASAGRESTYDITRTYRIIRPRLAE